MERTTPFIIFAAQAFSFLLEKKSNFCDAYEGYIIQILVNENKERSGDKRKMSTKHSSICLIKAIRSCTLYDSKVIDWKLLFRFLNKNPY